MKMLHAFWKYSHCFRQHVSAFFLNALFFGAFDLISRLLEMHLKSQERETTENVESRYRLYSASQLAVKHSFCSF